MIPDQADRAQGIAGRTWAGKGIVAVDGLPDLGNNPTEEAISDYANRTFVSFKWLKRWIKKEHPSRSFQGVPIEVKGKPWGVVVLDSRDERPIGPKARREYNALAKVLGAILERPGL